MRRICGRYCSLQTGPLSRSRSAATAAGTGHPLWMLDTHCSLDRFWPVVFLPYESLATGPVDYGRDSGTQKHSAEAPGMVFLTVSLRRRVIAPGQTMDGVRSVKFLLNDDTW